VRPSQRRQWSKSFDQVRFIDRLRDAAAGEQQQQQPQQQQPQQQQQQLVDIDAWLKEDQDPFLAPEAQQERQVALGLKETTLAAFIDKTEFVSIGNFCAAANALQALGLRRHAYPFDWVRSSAAASSIASTRVLLIF